MSRSYLDKENQHILTHTKDNRVNSFIANVNELVRHVDGILYYNTIFNQEVVDVLREALETDFTELLKDLKKGNHLGNRQLDINLLKNMSKWNEHLTEEEQKNIWLDKEELVYYDSALVKFIDGTTHRIVFQFDGVEGTITTHGDLLLQLNSDEEFLAKLEKTSANTFPAKVVGEYLKLYDKLGENSNVEGIELNAVRGKYKEKNPYYYWIATTSALQVLAMRSTEIIKLGAHIDKVVSLALNVDQMLELQNRLPQLVDTYDEEGNPKGDITIYNHLTELLEIYSKLDYLLDVVNLAEAAENNANMAEQSADEALTHLNKIQSIKVGRTLTLAPSQRAEVQYDGQNNTFSFYIPQGVKGERGEPFQVNASGTMEQRALYDDRPKGFSFLCMDTSEVFFRKSDTHADWTDGVPFGKGDKGDKGDKGEDGKTPELSDSIDSASSLTAASSKAVKTVNDKWSAIGTAATMDVGTDTGNVMQVGAFGLGNLTPLREVDLDELQSTSSLYYQTSSNLASTELNYPLATSGSLLNMVMNNGAGVQEFTSANTSRKFFRTKTSVWRPWVEVHTTRNLLQATGNSTEFPMSQKAVTDALGQPSMTGSATLNGTTNNTLTLTEIVTTLGLEVGDVIRIQYSGYDKLHSVESITNNNLIVVNYEHAGNRGNGILKLPDTTTTVTITRIAKWYNAPIGLGQAWMDVVKRRAGAVTYTNTAGRSIQVSLFAAAVSCTTTLTVDGVDVCYSISTNDNYWHNFQGQAVIPAGATYILTGSVSGLKWRELR